MWGCADARPLPPAPSRPNPTHSGERKARPRAAAQGLGQPGGSEPGSRSLAAAAAPPGRAGNLPPAGLQARAPPSAVRGQGPPRARWPLHLFGLRTAASSNTFGHRSPLAGGRAPLSVCKAAGSRSAPGRSLGQAFVRGCGCVRSAEWPRQPRILHPGCVQ